MMKKVTSLKTKLHNHALVLRIIFIYNSISRADIAHLTNFNKKTLTELVDGLLHHELVSDLGKEGLLGTKNPTLLSTTLNPLFSSRMIHSQSKIMGAIVNLQEKVKQKIELTISNDNGASALITVFQIPDKLTHYRNNNFIDILLRASRLINSQQDIFVYPVSLDWYDLKIEKLLNQKYKKFVIFLNDKQVFHDAAHYLVISLANLISVLNIRKLILTGEVVHFGDDWLQTFKSSI